MGHHFYSETIINAVQIADRNGSEAFLYRDEFGTYVGSRLPVPDQGVLWIEISATPMANGHYEIFSFRRK